MTSELFHAAELIAASSSGRFWLQFTFFLAFLVVSVIVLYGQFSTAARLRKRDVADDYETALDAKDAVKEGLAERVAALEATNAELHVAIAQVRADHKLELAGLRRFFEAKIAELESRLEDYECIVASGCPNRKRRPVTVTVSTAI